MIWGASEYFCTLRVHRGVHRVQIWGTQREQNTALNFVPFWFPYLNTLLCRNFQPHLLPHGTHFASVQRCKISYIRTFAHMTISKNDQILASSKADVMQNVEIQT